MNLYTNTNKINNYKNIDDERLFKHKNKRFLMNIFNKKIIYLR